MGNQNFIQEEQAKSTTPAVVPPKSNVTGQPFTVDYIREQVMRISFGQMDFTDLADELNRVAHKFYAKK